MALVLVLSSGCTINVIRNRNEGWTFVRITSFFDQSAKAARLTAVNPTNGFEVYLSGYTSKGGDNIRAAGTATGSVLGEVLRKTVAPIPVPSP